MVSYTRWVEILFETYPGAQSTVVMTRAGETWSENKQLLQDATVSEARELAKQV